MNVTVSVPQLCYNRRNNQWVMESICRLHWSASFLQYTHTAIRPLAPYYNLKKTYYYMNTSRLDIYFP